MKAFLIYCSGSIAKGPSNPGKLYWTDADRMDLADGARPNHVGFLNPDDPLVEAQNTLGQFGRDMYQVMVASAVVVDARQRRGIGVGVEMAASAALGTPLIIVAPPETSYRRARIAYRGAVVSNYVHPHVASLADVVVCSFEEAGSKLGDFAYPKKPHQVPAWLKRAIAEYEAEILPSDARMLNTLAEHRALARRR